MASGPIRVEGQGHRVGRVASVPVDIRRKGRKVVPSCPFVAAYIERHPEWDDLVAETVVAD